MRPAFLRIVTLLLFAVAMPCAAARAAVLRIVASDARGVTLQVSTEAWSLTEPGADGRVRVVGVPEAHSLADPGHALLPAYSTMLAVPPGAHPTVRVLAAEAQVVREGVRLAIAARPSFTRGEGGDYEPGLTAVPPLNEGAWPLEQALLGAVSSFRGRRLVGLEVRPFQYDEATGTLRSTASLTVRVDFNRPSGSAALAATVSAPDAHADPVLRSAVLNFDQAEPWRVAPSGFAGSLFGRQGSGPAAATAFDESQPEVRVTVDSTGVWVLPFDLLAAKGYPAGVPIDQVSVHRHEFLEGSLSQPFTTIEVPIEVEDANGDGTFDTGDRIWTYVRTWAERSGASHYQRWWGDAEVIYATANPAGGLRMARREGWRGAASPTPLLSYPAFQHWEQNYGIIMPFINSPTDTNDVDIFQWTTQVFYHDRQDTIAFTVNSIDTSQSVQFAVNWVGRSHLVHNNWAAVKNNLGQLTTIADSVVWSDKRARTASSPLLHGSALSEGLNKLVLWGKNSTGAPTPTSNDLVGFNWFEATYWRRFEAVHDVLACNSGGQSGEYQLHASGFLADSLRVYDVTTPESPVRIHVDEAHVQRGSAVSLDLQDSVATGQSRSYVIAAAMEPLDPAYGPRVPADDHVAPVTRLSLGTKTAADYIMVVPEAFLPAMQPLVTLRQSLGMQVVVATAEDVYDEFNGGRHSATALRRLAKYAYNRWNTRFLLLVGDGAMDALNHTLTSGPDWIPVNPVAGPVAVDGYEVTVSDNIYGCITGNCDPIGGSGIVIPELMIGRLPVNSLADAQAVVSKLVAYEDLSGDQAWRRHLLLNSDDAFSGDAFSTFGTGTPGYCWKDYEEHFVGLNQKIRSIVLRDAGLSQMNVENWNLRYYLAQEPVTITPPPFPGTPGDTCRPSMQDTRSRTHARVMPLLFSSLNSGALWWNYQGHANELVLTHEDLYINSEDSPTSDDKWQFSNTNQPVIFTAFSCHANMFARFYGAAPPRGHGGCLGEDMVTLPQRGAVASWASVCYEVVPNDDSTHLNVELARAMFASPPRDPQLWDHGSRVVLGEAIQAAYLRYLPMVSGSPWLQGVAITYTLLGDPATRVSIGRPQSVVFANGASVTDGQRVSLHTPGDTLTLVADLVSTARLDSLGLFVNSGGPESPVPAAQYALNPAFPDTVAGGTYGGRRFRLTYGTHLPAQTRNYTLRVKDRDGLATTFAVAFVLDATLRSGGNTIPDGDQVSPVADLSVMLVSPAPIDPLSDVRITINGAARSFAPAAVSTDPSGREWILSWTHEPYAKGDYVVEIVVRGASNLTRRFRVTTATNDLQISNLFAFPNPFDDAGTAFTNKGTAFSYQLLSSDLVDVRISVSTISGRRIWSQEYRGQAPGYHQVPWDGRDAEGDEIANGIYFYRLSATTPAGLHAEQLGRIVKLRKPRHIDPTTTP